MLPKGLILLVACVVSAQELPATDQTAFNFPRKGSGVLLPFPPELAQLTGLSAWPAGWVTPPFTPNMAKLYNSSATATVNDISVPPDAKRKRVSKLLTYVLEFCQTFDDGPTNVTSTLLDYLDSVKQKTTFFEIGSQVVQNYQLTQREYASGHQIADHTWSHPDLTTLSPQQVYAELAWTIYAIHAAIGQTPKYFRPPFGFINDNVRRVAAQLGLTVSPSNFEFSDHRRFYGLRRPMTGRSDRMQPIQTSPSSILLRVTSGVVTAKSSSNMTSDRQRLMLE